MHKWRPVSRQLDKRAEPYGVPSVRLSTFAQVLRILHALFASTARYTRSIVIATEEDHEPAAGAISAIDQALGCLVKHPLQSSLHDSAQIGGVPTSHEAQQHEDHGDRRRVHVRAEQVHQLLQHRGAQGEARAPSQEINARYN